MRVTLALLVLCCMVSAVSAGEFPVTVDDGARLADTGFVQTALLMLRMPPHQPSTTRRALGSELKSCGRTWEQRCWL